MAETTQKHSADPTNLTPALTDLLLTLNGVPSNQNVSVSALKALIQKSVDLDPVGGWSFSPGRLSYDPITKTGLMDTGYGDVRNNIGQQHDTRFYNDTGATITNGTPINAMGVDETSGIVKGHVLDASGPATSSAFLGIATHDVLDGEVGLATRNGEVNGVDTSGLTLGGLVYAGPTGTLTNTFQKYPARVVIVGTCTKVGAADGILLVEATNFTRGTGFRSYSFTQANVAAGTYYSAGFYDAPETDITLSNSNLDQTHGSANQPYEAHAFAVFAGNGTVDTGQVGLRVVGARIDTSTGIVTEGYTVVVTDDITAPALNEYIETSEKWYGEILYELYTVSGTPTTYSVDFNYGYAKYEDIGNNDFTITGIEITGTAGGNDSSFNVELLKHSTVGWVYAATGFVPGNGTIAELLDVAPYNEVTNGEPFAFKRPNLNEFIEGGGAEGLLFRFTCGTNNTVRSSDAHIFGLIEELIY